MGLFDEKFNFEEYVRNRMMQMDSMENRELFKDIVCDMMVHFYGHVREEYQALEKRVFEAAPKADNLPDIVTGMCRREAYDVTDRYMFPMDESDLEDTEVETAKMLYAVKKGTPFYLYTCFFEEDVLELWKLAESGRSFRGIIENEYGETPATFTIKPNKRYLKMVADLYPLAQLNQAPWRTVNCPYLFKLFDVYVTEIDQWDDQLQVVKVTVDFEEYADNVRYDLLPIWNLKPVVIKANAYPQPAVERGYYEHYLYKRQFQEGKNYMLRKADGVLRDIFWSKGDLYIICDSELPGDWEFYECSKLPSLHLPYTYPLMSNGQRESFSRNMMEHYGQRVKTRTDLIRLLMSFYAFEGFSFEDMKVVPKMGQAETYSMEEFVKNEFRSGEQDRMLVVSLSSRKPDDFCQRDIMSFFATVLQHFFPEYECRCQMV